MLASSSLAAAFAALMLTTPLGALAQQPTPAASVVTQASLGNPTQTATTATGTETSSSAAAPTSTSVGTLALGDTHVPYLLMRPPSFYGDDQRGPRLGSAFYGCGSTSGLNGERIRYAAPQNRINVSAVYAQWDDSNQHREVSTMPTGGAGMAGLGGDPQNSGILRITAIGSVDETGYAFSNQTSLLSPIQVESDVLTFQPFFNYTYLCDRIYPSNPDTLHPLTNPPSCQYGPGQVAFGVSIPLNSTYRGSTLWTKIQLSDPSSPALTVACISVPVTPYKSKTWYWALLMWFPIALFIAYFVTGSVAQVATAVQRRRRTYRNRAREGGPPTFMQDRLSPAIVSALSGKGIVESPSLLRFATPGCWDILHHVQFVAVMAMVAVKWPDFTYPFFRQAAWAALLTNSTLIQHDATTGPGGGHYDVLDTSASFLPAGDIGSQMGNAASPLYMNAAQPNVFLNLGHSRTGIEALAAMLGLKAADMFGTCLAIFLLVIAAVLVASALAFVIDAAAEVFLRRRRDREERGVGALVAESAELKGAAPADGKTVSRSSGSHLAAVKGLLRGGGTHDLHRPALQGNLLRIVALFHLPVVILSVYQFSFASEHSTSSVALAALSFVAFGLLAPVYVCLRISRMPINKLYEDVPTLLRLGPVYSTFSPGSQLFYLIIAAHSLALGIVVGAGQESGSAQAIVILLLEVGLGLACSLWLPWGEGAMMGPLSFLISVIRVITAVLVLLLSPVVGFSAQAGGWIAYVILLLQGVFFLGALLVLAVKLVEALVRIVWRVPFDDRKSGRTAGLGGAIRRIRRRKQSRLQLRHPGSRRRTTEEAQRHLAAHRTSVASSSHLMLAPAATRPTVPPEHSRTASYGSYLDASSRLYTAGSAPNSMGTNTTANTGLADYFKDAPAGGGGGNPYSAYFRSANDDDEGIMAAMPPTSPAWDRTPLYAGGELAPAPQRSGSPSPNNLGGASPPSGIATGANSAGGSGFVRVGGGRATDADPYSRLPPGAGPGKNGAVVPQQQRQQAPPAAPSQQLPSQRRTPRPQSQSGEIGQWAGAGGAGGVASTVDPRSSYYALRDAQTAAQVNSSQTSGAAERTRKKSGGTAAVGALGGLFRGRSKRVATNEDEDWSEDEEDDEEDEDEEERKMWRSGTQKWAGVAKINAAFRRLRGAPPEEEDGALEKADEAAAAAGAESKGFEVVRKPRPSAGGGGGGLPLDSTAQAAALSSASTPAQLQSSPAPAQTAPSSSAHGTPRVLDVSLAGGAAGNARPRGALGMLSADMDLASPSSEGHGPQSMAADDERFWLPPGAKREGEGGEGLLQGPGIKASDAARVRHHFSEVKKMEGGVGADARAPPRL